MHSIGLQSPARLANSRNSSTNTLKQMKANLMVNGSQGETEEQGISNESNAKKLQKKIFLFNQ